MTAIGTAITDKIVCPSSASTNIALLNLKYIGTNGSLQAVATSTSATDASTPLTGVNVFLDKTLSEGDSLYKPSSVQVEGYFQSHGAFRTSTSAIIIQSGDVIATPNLVVKFDGGFYTEANDFFRLIAGSYREYSFTKIWTNDQFIDMFFTLGTFTLVRAVKHYRVWLTVDPNLFTSKSSASNVQFNVWTSDGNRIVNDAGTPLTFTLHDTVEVVDVVDAFTSSTVTPVSNKYVIQYYPGVDAKVTRDGTANNIKLATIKLTGGRLSSDNAYNVYVYEQDGNALSDGASFDLRSTYADHHSEIDLFYDVGANPASSRDESIKKDIEVTVTDQFRSVTFVITIVPIANPYVWYSNTPYHILAANGKDGLPMFTLTNDEVASGFEVGKLLISTSRGTTFSNNASLTEFIIDGSSVKLPGPITTSYTVSKSLLDIVKITEAGRTFNGVSGIQQTFYVIPIIAITKFTATYPDTLETNIASWSGLTKFDVDINTGYGPYTTSIVATNVQETTLPETFIRDSSASLSSSIILSTPITDNNSLYKTLTDVTGSTNPMPYAELTYTGTHSLVKNDIILGTDATRLKVYDLFDNNVFFKTISYSYSSNKDADVTIDIIVYDGPVSNTISANDMIYVSNDLQNELVSVNFNIGKFRSPYSQRYYPVGATVYFSGYTAQIVSFKQMGYITSSVGENLYGPEYNLNSYPQINNFVSTSITAPGGIFKVNSVTQNDGYKTVNITIPAGQSFYLVNTSTLYPLGKGGSNLLVTLPDSNTHSVSWNLNTQFSKKIVSYALAAPLANPPTGLKTTYAKFGLSFQVTNGTRTVTKSTDTVTNQPACGILYKALYDISNAWKASDSSLPLTANTVYLNTSLAVDAVVAPVSQLLRGGWLKDAYGVSLTSNDTVPLTFTADVFGSGTYFYQIQNNNGPVDLPVGTHFTARDKYNITASGTVVTKESGGGYTCTQISSVGGIQSFTVNSIRVDVGNLTLDANKTNVIISSKPRIQTGSDNIKVYDSKGAEYTKTLTYNWYETFNSSTVFLTTPTIIVFQTLTGSNATGVVYNEGNTVTRIISFGNIAGNKINVPNYETVTLALQYQDGANWITVTDADVVLSWVDTSQSLIRSGYAKMTLTNGKVLDGTKTYRLQITVASKAFLDNQLIADGSGVLKPTFATPASIVLYQNVLVNETALAITPEVTYDASKVALNFDPYDGTRNTVADFAPRTTADGLTTSSGSYLSSYKVLSINTSTGYSDIVTNLSKTNTFIRFALENYYYNSPKLSFTDTTSGALIEFLFNNNKVSLYNYSNSPFPVATTNFVAGVFFEYEITSTTVYLRYNGVVLYSVLKTFSKPIRFYITTKSTTVKIIFDKIMSNNQSAMPANFAQYNFPTSLSLPSYNTLMKKTGLNPLFGIQVAGQNVTSAMNSQERFMLTVIDTTPAPGDVLGETSTVALDSVSFTTPNQSVDVNAPAFFFNSSTSKRTLYFDNTFNGITFNTDYTSATTSPEFAINSILGLGVPSMPTNTTPKTFAVVFLHALYNSTTNTYTTLKKTAYKLAVINSEVVKAVTIQKSSQSNHTSVDCLRFDCGLTLENDLGCPQHLVYSLRAKVNNLTFTITKTTMVTTDFYIFYEDDIVCCAKEIIRSYGMFKVSTGVPVVVNGSPIYLVQYGSSDYLYNERYQKRYYLSRNFTTSGLINPTLPASCTYKEGFWFEISTNLPETSPDVVSTGLTQTDLATLLFQQQNGFGYPEKLITDSVLNSDILNSSSLTYYLWIQNKSAYTPSLPGFGLIQSNLLNTSTLRTEKHTKQSKTVGIMPNVARFTTTDEGKLVNGLQTPQYMSISNIYDSSNALVPLLTPMKVLSYNV